MLYLLGSLGLPGSGKSTFLKRFAAEEHFFYWQNDEVRRRLYERPRHDRREAELLGRTARYVFEQALDAGASCIYDVNLNQRRHRREYAELAQAHGAQFVLLWFQVSPEVAKARVGARAEAATGEQRVYLQETFRPNVVEFMAARLQEPAADERCVIIDGTAPYEQQVAGVKAAIMAP
jgi:predicted kinase